MQFRNVIGQDAIKSRLIASVKEQRISHAQMFVGPKGSGKLALAIAFAQYISCKNRTADDSCGHCSSCVKYAKLAHPDLHFVFPVFKKGSGANKPISDDFIKEWRKKVLSSPYFTLNQWLAYINNENAQGMIYEAESAAIIKKLSFKSFESEFKIMIIWQPEMMNLACSNKLLKIIEEPPQKTYFLLVSDREEKIIPTIRSRVQSINVPALKIDQIANALTKNFNIESEAALDLAKLTKGDYIKAINLINNSDDTEFYFAQFQKLMRLAYLKDVIGVVDWADDMAKLSRDKQKYFFTLSLNWLREYFVFNLHHAEINSLSRKERDWGNKFAPFINEKNIVPLTNEFELCIKHISMNGNQRIIFLDVALRVIRLLGRR